MGERSAALSGEESCAELRSPRLARLYRNWLERKGDRRFPRRRDIDPLDMPYILGNVLLVDVLRVCACMAPTWSRRARYDLTGKLIDDLPIAEYRNYVLARCRALVESGEPIAVLNDPHP